MAQPGRRLHFAEEQLLGAVGIDELRREHFERDDAIHRLMNGFVDAPHAALAEWSRIRYGPRKKPLLRPASSILAWNFVNSFQDASALAISRVSWTCPSLFDNQAKLLIRQQFTDAQVLQERVAIDGGGVHVYASYIRQTARVPASRPHGDG